MPNSRFALHGLASPPSFTVCALFLPPIHGLMIICVFLRQLLTPVSTAPFFCQPLSSRFAVHARSKKGPT